MLFLCTKVAATKCRNKKKERTTRLVSESEILEMQNSSLKQVSFSVGCSDLCFSRVSENEILKMQNSSLKQVSFTVGVQ
jgi:hypothetical protein